MNLRPKAEALKKRSLRGSIVGFTIIPVTVVLFASLSISHVIWPNLVELLPVRILSYIAVALLWPCIISLLMAPSWIRLRKNIRHLEDRRLLGRAALEMESDNLVPFGEKAYLSEHFLFSKKKGIVIPCDEILWLYTTYFRRYYALRVGTKYSGIVCLSGVRSGLLGNRNYKQVLQSAATELVKRKPDVLLTNTRENQKAYKQMVSRQD